VYTDAGKAAATKPTAAAAAADDGESGDEDVDIDAI